MPDADQLWAEYLADRSDENRNALAVHYMPLANKHAFKIAVRLPYSVEEEDCDQYAMIGLLQAIERFDPARGVTFTKFCESRIRGSIIDGLRPSDTRTRRDRRVGRMVATIRDELRNNGLSATDDETREQLGASVSEFMRIYAPRCGSQSCETFDSRVNSHLTSDGELSDDPARVEVADAEAASPVWEAHKRSLLKLITTGMNKTERVILILYYYEGQTMREIGESIGFTKSRVWQLLGGIIKRLKARLAGREDEFTK